MRATRSLAPALFLDKEETINPEVNGKPADPFLPRNSLIPDKRPPASLDRPFWSPHAGIASRSNPQVQSLKIEQREYM